MFLLFVTDTFMNFFDDNINMSLQVVSTCLLNILILYLCSRAQGPEFGRKKSTNSEKPLLSLFILSQQIFPVTLFYTTTNALQKRNCLNKKILSLSLLYTVISLHENWLCKEKLRKMLS